MIVMLSNLLRTALKQGQTDLIPLSEELKFVEDYLAIEKIRLCERLDVRWDIDSATRSMLLPHFILQPLVENAIVHGIACCREGGWVQIASRQDANSLEIQVSNSMCGVGPGQGTGVGLPNTKGRLKYLYGDEARLEFSVHDDQFASATLTVPAFHASHPEKVGIELQQTAVEDRDARPDRR